MFDIASAVASASAMLTLAKGAIAARDDFKAQQAISDAQGKLLEITAAALSLSQTNIALTDEIRALKDAAHELEVKARDRQGYALAEVCPGAYAYKSQPGEEGTDVPLHYLCQLCYDKGIKSVLRVFHQPEVDWSSAYRMWECAENKEHNITRSP